MSPLATLLIAIAALLPGPLMAGMVGRSPRLRAGLDGFVLFVVGGLCLRFLLPHAYESLGAWAFLVAMAGLLLPHLAERRLHQSGTAESSSLLILALLGLGLHAAIDGAGLSLGNDLHGSHLPQETQLGMVIAVLVHRLPVGLFLWWSVKPRLGQRRAIGILVGLGLATALGYVGGEALHHTGEGWIGGVLQALLAGGLLHIVAEHAPSHQLTEPGSRRPAAIGGLLGLGLFLMLPGGHSDLVSQAVATTKTLWLESAPAILLGFLGAGLLSLVRSEWLLARMSAASSLRGALKGIILGLPLPICSCGVVPLYRGLAARGVAPAAAVAFLVATPELGLDAILLTIPLLGWKFAVLRVLAAFGVALMAGLVAGWLANRMSTPPETIEAPADLPLTREGSAIKQVARYGFGEMVDEMGPWIALGLIMAGALEPLLDPVLLSRVPDAWQVPLFALLGTPLYICASGATPVGAILLAKGVSPGAVLALLLAGPATNITTFGALRASSPLRHAIILILVIPLGAILSGWVVNSLGIVAGGDAPMLHEHAAPWWKVGAGWILGALLVASYFRQGPRGFLQQLGLGHEHDHDHGTEGGNCCH